MKAWPIDDAMGPSVTRASSAATYTQRPSLKNGGELRGTGYLIGVGSRTSRFRRKHKFKLCLVIMLILLCAIVMNLIAVAFVRHMLSSSTNLCETKECLRSAANLALSIDKTTNPCHDFYQHVCGNWAKNHPRPDEYTTFDWFADKETRVYAAVRDFLESDKPDASQNPKPVIQTKIMYEACMDVDTLDALGLQPVTKVLDELGLPPYPKLLNATGDNDYTNFTFDWLEAVIKIKKKLGMDVLIGFDIFFQINNFTEDQITIGSPETTQPLPSMHGKNIDNAAKRYSLPTLKKPTNIQKKDKYHTFYYNLMAYFVLEEEQFANSTYPVLVTNLDKASEIYYTMNEDINALQSYNVSNEREPYKAMEYTAEQIQTHTDLVVAEYNGTATPIWKRYLEGIFTISEQKVDFEKETVSIHKLDLIYLSSMAAYVSKISPAQMELYVWMKVVILLAADTTKDIYKLFETIHPTAKVTHRSVRCASAVNEMLGLAVAYAIADPDYLTVTKPKVETMLKNLKSSLAHLVGETKWMDDNTKLKTYRKIIEMKTLIGFPDWLLEEGKLEAYYKGVEVDKTKHLENMISSVQVEIKAKLDDYRNPHEFIWYTEPTAVNAYYIFEFNSISVPMVMLQYPFYDLGVESLNYGSLGAIIGHEIAHGFDNLGRLYDKNGRPADWWSNETISSFLKMEECFIKQYSSFYIPELDKKIDGVKTLGENIADNGGVREAFAAFKRHQMKSAPEPKLPGFEGYTSEQLFFLSYANLWCGVTTNETAEEISEDEHSPMKFRVIGSLLNSENFAKAWNCPRDSAMNPSEKCVIF